jgi:hypothetical protein
MRARIEAAADVLTRDAPVFTKRNLCFAVARAAGGALDEKSFERALRQGRALEGLLTSRTGARARRANVDAFPEAVLLVDRREVLELFEAMARATALTTPNLAVACIDGRPAPLVARLARGFEEGLRAPVFYLHDAATVIYPFAVEPLATLVRHRKDKPMAYRDLGLAPLGASARRFGDPTLPTAEPLLELEAIPPASLARYVARCIASAAAGAPS